MIRTLMQQLDFPAEAVTALGRAFDGIAADPEAFALLANAADAMFLRDDNAFTDKLQSIADKTGIHRYTVDMVFLLFCGRALRYLYASKGYSEKLFLAAMSDTRFKLLECRRVYDVWGTFVLFWYPGFYRMTRFKLGRLQYDVMRQKDGDIPGFVREGDPVLNCHIPSSGPLLSDEVNASLRMAYDFLPESRVDGALAVQCNSWLLYPPLVEKLPADSNIRRFADRFTVYNQKEDPGNNNFWRVFGVKWHEGALNEVTPKSSLEKAVCELIAEGGTMGVGFGILRVTADLPQK